MKITDVTLTLFAWESIPSTIYGHHTARPTRTAPTGPGLGAQIDLDLIEKKKIGVLS
jgi:hypothetical protein